MMKKSENRSEMTKKSGNKSEMTNKSGNKSGMMKKRDIIFICSIVAVALVLLAVFFLLREDGSYVVVRVDGEEVARYNLDRDGEYSLNGGTNILKIEGGEAWMIEADCPQISGKKCTAQGRISKTGEVITCLPNKLTVTVYGEDGDTELVVK